MTKTNIVERIQKLMALADKAGTPEEAEAAFAKAQELMIKHAINEANLREAGHEVKSEPIVTKYVTLKHRDEIRSSKLLLYMRVAEANQCNMLAGHDYVVIVGHESATEFVELLVANILIQYAGERTKAWKAYQARFAGNPPESRFKWVNGFSWGYAARIGERIKETTRTSSKGGELVLVGRKSEVDEWMSQNMTVGKGRAMRNRSSWASRNMGAEAANRADISGGRNNVKTRSNRSLGR